MSAHGCNFQVTDRDSTGHAITWCSTCRCKQAWKGPTYEAVEDEWRKHVHTETGTAPVPMGNKTGRWAP